MTHGESRPAPVAEAAPEVLGGDLQSAYDGGPTIGGHVIVNAQNPSKATARDRLIERNLKDLCYAPAGAAVTIRVSRGQLVEIAGVECLRAHGRHLGSITIECPDPGTIRRWVDALRNGRTSHCL